MTSSRAAGVHLFAAARIAFPLALLLLTLACASSFERPAHVDLTPLRERAVSKVEENIRVSAAVPSASESRSIFGIDLERQNVQPLWLEIKNSSGRSFYLLQTGLNPEYFRIVARCSECRSSTRSGCWPRGRAAMSLG